MKLASIEIIKSIKQHSNADRLELAQVLGWQSVVQKGIHKEGDKVVFIVIDSIVPKCSWSEFLVDKNNPDKPIRLKMIKLRGEHSAGIIIPLKEFEAKNDQDVSWDLNSCEVGYDLTELLGVKKYVKELPANLSGENAGAFPTHLASKTDEDNGLSNLDIVDEVIKQPLITITQKLDGSSITIIVENGKISEVCSRNLSKKETDNSIFWKAAKKLHYLEGFTGVIQGELVGPGIQKNPLRLEDHQIFVFQIKKSSGEYMQYQEMKGFCNIELKCNVVPLVAECSFIGCDLQTALEKLGDLSDQQKYSSGEFAEGIVVRPSTYLKSFASRRPLGFKILSRNYKDN
jgi:RNA ligase (TIGR02306 family)